MNEGDERGMIAAVIRQVVHVTLLTGFELGRDLTVGKQ